MSRDKNEMLISIIVPCYNSEKFIAQAIESVISQPLQEIELIIVNDGSVDKTVKICEPYCEKDSRVKLYTIENHGAGYARNFGLDQASGKWIAYLDADDLYLCDSLNEKMSEFLNQCEKDEIDIVFTSKCESDMSIQKPIQYSYLQDNIAHIPDLEFFIGIYRHTFLKQNNIKFFEYKKQDIESAFRYRTFSKAKRILNKPSICFYLRRLNPESNTHTWNLFTLHCIKATVYGELLNECEKESDKKWLFEIIQQEIYEFYKQCLRANCSDRDYLKSVNMKYLECKNMQYFKNSTKAENSIHVKNSILYPAANIAQKIGRFNECPYTSSQHEQYDNKMIQKRLDAISKYVKNCILD